MEDKRLIDANELISEFEWFESVVNEYKKEEVRAYIQRIKNAPTVNAVEVVHGRWKEILGVIGNYECSLCGCIPYYAGNIHTLNYCPNCGADMRGGAEDGKTD